MRGASAAFLWPIARTRRCLPTVPEQPETFARERERYIAAWAFEGEELKLIEATAESGNERVGSLGYDGPLAALSYERQNIADYFKESVAVVTNPAIDREREIEQFSTRVVLGPRPPLNAARHDGTILCTEMLTPLLTGGLRGSTDHSRLAKHAAIAHAARHLDAGRLHDL